MDRTEGILFKLWDYNYIFFILVNIRLTNLKFNYWLKILSSSILILFSYYISFKVIIIYNVD